MKMLHPDIPRIHFTINKFNSFPNDTILDQPKFKAFPDDKMKVAEKNEICIEKGRKHCWKRRKCWLPAFSSFPTMFFQKDSFTGSLKVAIVWQRIKQNIRDCIYTYTIPTSPKVIN